MAQALPVMSFQLQPQHIEAAAPSEDLIPCLGGTSHVRLPNRLGFLKGHNKIEPGVSLRCNTADILTFQKMASSDVVEMWREKLKFSTENHKVKGKRSIRIASDFG